MSKVIWQKSEARDVRPFFGTVKLERCMDGAELRLAEGGEFSSETGFQLEAADVKKLAIALRLNLNRELEYGAVNPADLVVAVTVAQPFIKKLIVVDRFTLTAPLPEEIIVGDELLAELGGGANIDVEVALCLVRQLPKVTGSPFMNGHWLAKKTFSIRPPRQTEEFDVEETTDEAWQALGYPAKTAYLVEYIGNMNDPVSKDRKTARVRVHADIYKKLSLESNQKLAKPVLALLAAELSCQMLVTSYHDWKDDDEVVLNSPLSAFLKRLTRIKPECTFRDLKNMTEEPGMSKLRALLHADIGSVRAVAEA